MPRAHNVLKTALILLLSIDTITSAMAEDEANRYWWDSGKKNHIEGASRSAVTSSLAAPPIYQKECGACHMAYPAGLLPIGSWQHLIANLNQHFGNDASLDKASTSEITRYLASAAGSYKRVSEMPAQDRITQSSWFSRKHDRHVNASTWTRAAIGNRGNCAACHSGAEQGNFNEHSVRIPG